MPTAIPKPRFVYFDLDDTILDHRKAEKRALTDIRTTYKKEFADIDQKVVEDTYHANNVTLWQQYSAGNLTKEQLRIKRFEQLLQALGLTSIDADEISTYYIAQYTRYWDYCRGAEEGFFKIADKYPVGILTNGFAKIQHAKLAQFARMRDRLHACVISEEFGHMKPHPKLFAHAAELAQTAPEDILFVGDSMFSDVEGGQRAGWNVIWYAPHEQDPPSHVAHAKSWSEVTELIIEL